MRRNSLFFIVFILLFFLISNVTVSFAQSVVAKNHFKVGKSHLQAGRYEEAEKEFKEALKIEARYIDAQYLLGLTYFSQKKFDDAKKAIEEVIRQDGRFELARLYMAQIFLETNEPGKAKDQLQYVFKNDPKNVQACYGLGVVFYIEGDLQKAIDSWKKSIDLEKTYAPAYYNLGLALYLQNKTDDAKRMIEKAISFKPLNTLYQFSLAWIDYEKGDKKKALGKFETLKAIGGESPISLVSAGILDYDADNIDKALEYAIKAKDMDKQFQKAYELMAICYEKKQNWNDARNAYEEILKLDKNESDIRKRLESVNEKIKCQETEKKSDPQGTNQEIKQNKEGKQNQ